MKRLESKNVILMLLHVFRSFSLFSNWWFNITCAKAKDVILNREKYQKITKDKEFTQKALGSSTHTVLTLNCLRKTSKQ